MANEVRVDFVLNPSQLDAAVNQAVAKSVQGAKAVESAFSNSVAAVQKQALNLNFSLRQISDNLGGGIQQAALRSQAAISGTLGRLKELNFLMSQTRDPALLNRYEAEVAKLSSDLDRLQDKITRVAALRSGGGANGEGVSRAAAAGRLNLARQGGDVFTQLASSSPLSLIAIQQGPQILDALSQSGFKIEAAMAAAGTSFGALAASVGVTIPVIVAATVALDINKKSAEANTRTIEKGAIAYGQINSAIFNAKVSLIEFRNEQDRLASGRIFSKDVSLFVNNNDKQALIRQRDALQANLEIATKYRALTEAGLFGSNDAINKGNQLKEIEDFKSRINEVNEAISKVDDAQSKFLNPSNREDFAKDQQKRAEEEKKIIEERQKRFEAAQKLREQATNVFESLFARQAADNPFAKILSDDAKAVIELKKQLQGLSPEFLRLAEAQQKALTANSLFDARINATLGVSDLRSQASQFRNGQRGESSDDLLRRLGLNPEQFRSFSDIQKQSLANQVAVRQAVSFGNIGGNINGVNGVDLALGAFRNAQQQQSNIETPEQRFDRINRELRATSPANDAQRAILDRRLTQFTDPFALRQDQRNEVANALDREAERRARAEIEGIRLQNETNAILKQINASISKQTGTSLEVAIKPSAGLDIGVTPTPISPNQSQVNDLYPTEGGSFFNGQ